MTNSPADLLAIRADVLRLTGLGGNDVGIVGDTAHRQTGGYHEGRGDLAAVGLYHPHPVDLAAEDYSVRLSRDRSGLTESASAMDVGDNWPVGGRPAWIRFANLLVAALKAGDSALASIRAVNYSPDGSACLRVSRESGWAAKASSDNVNIHTHIEWYRDTEDTRAGACRTRLVQLVAQVITPTPGGTVATTDQLIAAMMNGMPTTKDGSAVCPTQWEIARERDHAALVTSQQQILTAVRGITVAPTSTGGLTDADRQAIDGLTAAVSALNSRLSTP